MEVLFTTKEKYANLIIRSYWSLSEKLWNLELKVVFWMSHALYDCQIFKVPATDVEALKSPLMGLFEKRRARKFFIYVQDYEENDPKSHEGLDLNTVTTKAVIS